MLAARRPSKPRLRARPRRTRGLAALLRFVCERNGRWPTSPSHLFLPGGPHQVAVCTQARVSLIVGPSSSAGEYRFTTPINANFIAFLAQEAKLKTVPYASLHRCLTFPPFAMAPCATDRKRVHFMEPGFRPSCRLFHTLPTFITRSFRNFKTSARFIRLKPQIAGFGSQRMCPSCGLITSRSKAFCLECGKPFPAGGKNATE